MPMLLSFWLSKKKGKEVFAKPVLDHEKGSVHFEIASGKNGVSDHTSDRAGARCFFCSQFIKKPELCDLSSKHGVDEIPLAIVAEGTRERVYIPSSSDLIPAAEKPDVPALQQAITNDKRWFSPPLYGLPEFADLFTPRQLTALVTFSDLVKDAREQVLKDAQTTGVFPAGNRGIAEGGTGPQAYADAVATYLAFGVDKLADRASTISTWDSGYTKIRSTFGRQALPMTWDFACIWGRATLNAYGQRICVEKTLVFGA